MRMFDHDAVHNALDYPGLISALERHHLKDFDDVRSHVLEQQRSNDKTAHFLALPAWQHDHAMGAKLITVFPENEKNDSGLPSVQAVYILFDGTNGQPKACIDGTALTLRKTAADSALGAKFLARNDAQSMLMVGAGAMAPHLIRAHRTVRPGITKVAIWNRTPARVEQLRKALRQDGVTVEVAEHLETAARSADIISCATMSETPLIKGDWLHPGTHLDLVGSYRTDMHECDERAIIRASVFTDSPWSAMEDAGEIVSALKSGALTADQVQANIFSFARGEHPGRTSPDEITLYKNGGGGHLDLMVAQHLCDVSPTSD